MADPRAPGEGLTQFLDKLRGYENRLRALENASGTQKAQAVNEIKKLVLDLQAQVADFINNQSYTRAAIDGKFTDERNYTNGKVANPGDITPGNVNSSGFLIVSGNANIQGVITSAGTRANPISTFRTVVQDDDGNMGFSSSARRTKQDFEDVDFDENIFRLINAQRFRYKTDVEANGDDARVDLGFIAEDLVAAGVTEPVFCNADGEAEGINYDRITPFLWMAVQRLLDDRDKHDQRLAALENG